MTTQTFTETLVALECGKCGVSFGMTETFYNRRRKDHKSWWCPNGCCRAYKGETDEEREIRQLRSRAAYFDEQRTRLMTAPSDVKDATHRAQHYGKAQRGAFWRGHEDRNCGRETGCCPYPTSRFGFRSAWFDGFGADYEEPADD